jgi:NADH-quinone oxidoreductase subunit N
VAQAGVPFTSGFIAKFGVIRAAVEEHSYALALIAMLTSVVAAFLYLRIMVSTWMSDPPTDAEELPPVRVPLSSGLAIGLAMGFTLFMGIYPEWIVAAAKTTTQFAR